MIFHHILSDLVSNFGRESPMHLKSPKTPSLPTIVNYVFFTVPIMAYIMKEGKNMNGGLSRSLKYGDIGLLRKPPPLWI